MKPSVRVLKEAMPLDRRRTSPTFLVWVCLFFVLSSLNFAAAQGQDDGDVGRPSVSRTVTVGPNNAYSVRPRSFDEQVFSKGKVFPSPSMTITVFNDTIQLNNKLCRDMLQKYSIFGPRFKQSASSDILSYEPSYTTHGGVKTADGGKSRKGGFHIAKVAPLVDFLTTTSADRIPIGGQLWSRESVKLLGLTNGITLELVGDDRYVTDSGTRTKASTSESSSLGKEEKAASLPSTSSSSSSSSFAADPSSGGDDANALSIRPEDDVYTFTIPTACLMSSYPPSYALGVTFVVGPRDREIIGQVMSFFVMIAACLCALCSLIGALLPLLLLQAFAALTLISCATPALLAETFFTHYVLFPARTYLASFKLHESTAIIMGIVALVVGLGELLHFLYESKTNIEQRHLESEEMMTAAAEEAMRDAAKRGVKPKSNLKVGDDGDDDDDGIFGSIIGRKKSQKSKKTDAASADGNETADGDASDSSFAAKRRRAASTVEETLQSVRETAAKAAGQAVSYFPMFPYIGACLLCMLFVGAVVHCAIIAFTPDTEAVLVGVAILGLLVIGIGLPMLSIGIWMRKGFVYCVYRVAQGGLPPSMHVSGVWGPNHMRLRFGIFCEDFCDSRRSMSVISIVYALILSFLAGSSPSSQSSCTTVFGVSLIATFAYGLLCLVLFPMRSKLNNYALMAINGFTFMYESAMMAFVTSATDVVTPSNTVSVAMVFGTLVCIASIVFAASHLMTAFWEIRGARAGKYTSLHHAEDALDAEMSKLQTQLEIEEGVEETLAMYRQLAKEAEDDEGFEAAMAGGHFSGAAAASAVAGAKRKRLLMKAKKEALEKARRERISGMRFAHDFVRPGRSLAVGDDRHPSYADFLLVDYHMVPESTRHEFKTQAMVKRAAEQNENNTGFLATLTFEEQMILQGKSRHHGVNHHRTDVVGSHNVSNHSTAVAVSGSVPHIYSTSTLVGISPERRQQIIEEQRRYEIRMQRKAKGQRPIFDDEDDIL